MVYQLITVTQTALPNNLVEEVMITVMLRLTSIQMTLSQLTFKRAAATALYGSRASSMCSYDCYEKENSKGLGVTISSSLTLGTDSSTLPRYQNKYGAGYGPYYASEDGYFS
jgi:hypothetical protein